MPFAAPTITTPVTFRQNATDADNHLTTNVAAAYVQDQIELSRHAAGRRRRCASTASTSTTTTTATATRCSRVDDLVSPRAGLVFKPIDAAVALWQLQRVVPAELGRPVLVADDDHAAGQAREVQQLRGRREVGRARRPVADDRGLPAGSHQHALDRSERPDPHRPDRQPAHQRLRARRQRPRRRRRGRSPAATPIRMRSSPARPRRRAAGAQVAQVPHHTLSLWNNYQVHPRLAAGLGVLHRTDMFAAIDNTVTLPGYTRADAAVYFTLTQQRRGSRPTSRTCSTQRYYINADSNTNISPGFPRTLRVALTTTF